MGLKEHFKQEHYLCEEENCANEQFTSVFRDEIDLKGNDINVVSSAFLSDKIFDTKMSAMDAIYSELKYF